MRQRAGRSRSCSTSRPGTTRGAARPKTIARPRAPSWTNASPASTGAETLDRDDEERVQQSVQAYAAFMDGFVVTLFRLAAEDPRSPPRGRDDGPSGLSLAES